MQLRARTEKGCQIHPRNTLDAEKSLQRNSCQKMFCFTFSTSGRCDSFKCAFLCLSVAGHQVNVCFSLQVFIIQYGGVWFATAGLTTDQWMWCLLFGLGGLLWGQVRVVCFFLKTKSPKAWTNFCKAPRTIVTFAWPGVHQLGFHFTRSILKSGSGFVTECFVILI